MATDTRHSLGHLDHDGLFPERHTFSAITLESAACHQCGRSVPKDSLVFDSFTSGDGRFCLDCRETYWRKRADAAELDCAKAITELRDSTDRLVSAYKKIVEVLS